MPYIVRDSSGKIIRASVQTLPGAQVLPFDHPDLIAFLRDNGQDPARIEEALAELRRTDLDMSRAVEDVVMVLLKKNILKMNDLPKAVQDKMSYRLKLRLAIQDTLEQAGQRSG